MFILKTLWCRRRDSNSHSFRHYHLKIACLPISPRRLLFIHGKREVPYGFFTSLNALEFTLKYVCFFSLNVQFPETTPSGFTLREFERHLKLRAQATKLPCQAQLQ